MWASKKSEKSCDISKNVVNRKAKPDTSVVQEEKNDLSNAISECKVNIEINEAGVNDLDLLCQLMKEKPAQIIKRFYQKQRCFIMKDGDKGKDCIWINYNNIEIPEINYQDKLPKNRFFLYLSKAELKEDSVNKYLQAINCIINMLFHDRYTMCYICINPNMESFKVLLNSMGFQTNCFINYKKIFFKSHININKKQPRISKEGITQIVVGQKQRV